MRQADNVSERQWRGLTVTVSQWIDWADEPWDGDEPLEPGSEGYDLLVSVAVIVNGERFEARDSLGSVWVGPGGDKAYVDSELENVTGEALTQLQAQLESLAAGKGVKRAQQTQLRAAIALSAHTYPSRFG
jgi:hypothetical protein